MRTPTEEEKILPHQLCKMLPSFEYKKDGSYQQQQQQQAPSPSSPPFLPAAAKSGRNPTQTICYVDPILQDKEVAAQNKLKGNHTSTDPPSTLEKSSRSGLSFDELLATKGVTDPELLVAQYLLHLNNDNKRKCNPGKRGGDVHPPIENHLPSSGYLSDSHQTQCPNGKYIRLPPDVEMKHVVNAALKGLKCSQGGLNNQGEF